MKDGLTNLVATGPADSSKEVSKVVEDNNNKSKEINLNKWGEKSVNYFL